MSEINKGAFEVSLEASAKLTNAVNILKAVTQPVAEKQAGELQSFNNLTQAEVDTAVLEIKTNGGNKYNTLLEEVVKINLAEAKTKITTKVKKALEDLTDTVNGGTAASYTKREKALRIIDEFNKTERLAAKAKADAATIEAYMHPKAKVAPAQLSSDQENTKARMAELEKAAASAPIQNNTPEDMARIAELDAATKTQRLDAAAARTAELQANLVGVKKTVAPVVASISADKVNTQARMTEINTAKDTRAAATEAINSMSLSDLTKHNKAKYESAVKSLTADFNKETTDLVKKGGIGNKIDSYESALKLRNIPKTDKLENERAFARALLELEARK